MLKSNRGRSSPPNPITDGKSTSNRKARAASPSRGIGTGVRKVLLQSNDEDDEYEPTGDEEYYAEGFVDR